jgi:O-antigen biosynthesis protein WbqP
MHNLLNISEITFGLEIEKDFQARRPSVASFGPSFWIQNQKYMNVKRMFDLLLALTAAAVLAVPVVTVAILVWLTSPGPALYWSDRVGRLNTIFKMPKFRSMRVGTPAVATHLLADPNTYLTPIGSFLRKSSLDELPQLWSILAGDMSFVGPRPALFNQLDLIELRTELGVHELVPGLTGWAQINGRDELPIPEKVKLDAEYLQRQSLWFDIRILWLTFLKVIRRDGVTH